MAGADCTVKVKVCVASGLTPLVAVMLNEYTPLLPAAGVPDRVAVPSPLSTKLTPLGSEPNSDNAGVGKPVEVTVKVPAEPSVNVVLAADVMAGADCTVKVKDCVASGLTPLVAVMVIG